MNYSSRIQNRYLPGPAEIASAAATELHGLIARHTSGEPFGIALSGGRIAKAFYNALVQVFSRSAIEVLYRFRQTHFFWADERCVPPFDAESNFSTAKSALFDPLQIPSVNIHRIFGEVEPAYAAAQAEAELCRIMPLNENGQPVLDLVILGMGEDGHIASLFPAEPITMLGDERVYRDVIATKPPPQRITLGYPAVLAARECWVLASGAGKQAAFKGMLEEDDSLPISRIVAHRERTLFFQDIQPAAQGKVSP